MKLPAKSTAQLKLGNKMQHNSFPTEFLKECIETYKISHGKSPKILVASVEDIMDWKLTNTFQEAKSLKIKVVEGKYLNPGEFDLAMEVKNDSAKKS